MVAKANNEGRSSSTPSMLKSPSNEVNDQLYVYADHEKQLLMKYIRLIQGNVPNKEISMSKLASPSDDTDITTSMISSFVSTSSQE